MSRQTIRLKDASVEKAIREVLDRLLKIEKAQESQVGPPKQTEGKDGDMRVVKGADGSNSLQVRSKEGWHTLNATFQEKE